MAEPATGALPLTSSAEAFPRLAPGATLHLTPREGTLFVGGIQSTRRVAHETAALLARCDGARSLSAILEAHLASPSRGGDGEVAAALVELAYLAADELVRFAAAPAAPAAAPPVVTGSASAFLPTHLQIELTNVCNLRCTHCYRSSGAIADERRLPTDRLIAIVDGLAALGLRSVELTGGEPLTHPDFERILDHCAGRFELVGLLTNGTLLSAGVVERWVPYRERMVVSVSLDGSTAATHERRRGVRGSFARTLEAIRLLAKHRFTTRVSMAVDEENWSDIEATLLLARAAGASSFGYTPVLPFGRARGSFRRWALDPNAVLTFENDFARRYAGFLQTYEERLLRELEKEGNCGAGHRAVAMDPEGRIRPCVSFETTQAILGSLDGSSPLEVFSSEMAFAATEAPPPTVETCAGCKWVMFCRYCVQRATLASQWTGAECRWAAGASARRFRELALATADAAREASPPA